MAKAHQDCPGNEAECKKHLLGLQDSLEILGGKWKIPIILALWFGNYRFKELIRMIEGITPRMLSKELKDLETNKLVTRTVYDTIPVSVEYALTPYGKSLQPLIMELGKWGGQHRKVIIGK